MIIRKLLQFMAVTIMYSASLFVGDAAAGHGNNILFGGLFGGAAGAGIGGAFSGRTGTATVSGNGPYAASFGVDPGTPYAISKIVTFT